MNYIYWYRVIPGKYPEEEIVASNFLLACLAIVIALVAGIGYVVYRIFNEVSLELGYWHKYGTGWQAEFEKYHGSLSHAHTQIAVGGACLLAVVVVLIWSCQKIFHRHKKYKNE